MKVFVAGTFDHFHIGHQYTLWRALNEGDQMVVIVARDKTVQKIKSKKSRQSEEIRVQRIRKEQLPNTIVRLGRSDAHFWQTLHDEKPDVLCLGYDQRISEKEIQKEFPNLIIKRMDPYYPDFFKSSLIK